MVPYALYKFNFLLKNPLTDEVVLPDRGVAAEGPARLQVHCAAGQSDAVVGILRNKFREVALYATFSHMEMESTIWMI